MHSDHKKSVRTGLIHFIMISRKKKKKKKIFLSEQYFVALSEELYYLLTEYCGEVRKDFMENLKKKVRFLFLYVIGPRWLKADGNDFNPQWGKTSNNIMIISKTKSSLWMYIFDSAPRTKFYLKISEQNRLFVITPTEPSEQN